MNIPINLSKNLLAFGIPFTMVAILVLIMKSPFLNGNDTLGLAVTIDLLLVVPTVYFLLIRKTAIPNATVLPIMILGLLIGSFLMPKDSQAYLALFKTWVLPVIEISVLTFIVIKVRTAIKGYKKTKGDSLDFFSALKSTCADILPQRLVLPLATEIAVIYYGFIDWKTHQLQENEFSYHKRSGMPALFIAFMFVIIIETFVVHLLLVKWSVVLAWVLTGLSIYTAIQILGFAKSLSRRPILINDNAVTLKYGILNEVEIPFDNIDTIELSGKPLVKDKFTKTLSPLGEIESHNVIIQLKEVNELIGIYGIKKKFKVIGLHIDEPKEFIETMDKALIKLT